MAKTKSKRRRSTPVHPPSPLPAVIKFTDLQEAVDAITEVVRVELTKVSKSIIGTVMVRLGSGDANPFLHRLWNLTRQGQAYKQDPVVADHMARFAGHVRAVGAKREDARDYPRPAV